MKLLKMVLKDWKIVRGGKLYSYTSYRKVVGEHYGREIVTIGTDRKLINPNHTSKEKAIFSHSYYVYLYDLDKDEGIWKKSFKTKSRALKYAKSYMRKH